MTGNCKCDLKLQYRMKIRISLDSEINVRSTAMKLTKAIQTMQVLFFFAIGFTGSFIIADKSKAETWRGLVVASENRCSPYNSKDYPYSQSVERRIVNAIGKMYSPYNGECFTSLKQSDIEHIVARSEAHDSGLCAASKATKKQFSSDLLNLTLASPHLNRQVKSHYDASQWVPELNQCWFAATVVAVKTKYGLTVDRREAASLEAILSKCSVTTLQVGSCTSVTEVQNSTAGSASHSDPNHPLAKWDDNGNGRITCKEARRHGITPVRRNHPAYQYMRDGNNDGIICK